MPPRVAPILRVEKTAAISAIRELIVSGKEVLNANSLNPYEFSGPPDMASRDSELVRATAQARERSERWYVHARDVCKEIFLRWDPPEPVLIGHNKLYPRLGVLYEILDSLDSSDSGRAEDAPLINLHPSIQEHCRHNLDAGHVQEGVFNALKTVEVALREKAGATQECVGISLVNYALNPKQPRLKLSSVPAEQEAAYHLFRGALGFFKNPLSHRFPEDSNDVPGVETVVLASLLMRLLERATPVIAE